jgi:hypothetical protein
MLMRDFIERIGGNEPISAAKNASIQKVPEMETVTFAVASEGYAYHRMVVRRVNGIDGKAGGA